MLPSRERQKQRLKKRNEKVRDFFNKTATKNPKWRIECVIEEVAERFFLAERTVEAIIKQEGSYAD